LTETLDLDGTWQVRWTDGQRGRTAYAERAETDPVRYIEARVPGEIHLDVMRAGWIDDPRVGTNCLAARWVEECLWSYRRFFDAPVEALGARAWLCFDGLDLAATIVLNGEEIGRHANSFHPCRLEVTGKLRPGRNLLTVHVDGGLYEVAEKPYTGYGVALDAKLHKRHWLRKPQCQFSWDWSTRLINVGITGSVRLEWTTDPVRADQFVPLAELSPDLRTGRLRARLFVEGLGPEPVTAVLRAALPQAGVAAEREVVVQPGLHPYEVELTADAPELWWPVGHGAPARYDVAVSLSLDGQVVAERAARVGFRHVRVRQDEHPDGGRWFVLEVNGRPVFAKGGNFVPADMILADLDRARYDRLTDLALEANCNLLRIWGGGRYESDDFYDLCDAKGLLVWQEFAFACGKYPVQDQAFYDSVCAEATHNIRRLASHPSLVIWCGNNEMEWGNWDWHFDRGVVFPDYALFHLTLPRLLAAEDGTRFYWPSSPNSPDGLHPNRDDVGDQHPWAVGFGNTDFRQYRTMACRFPNEGGILGPTALPTMLACLPAGQRQVQSFAWQVHDNSVDTWGEPSWPDQMITQWLGRDPRAMSIPEFTYWAGLVQGEGLREYCDNFRRRMFDTAAAVFWMYNDTWPATRSWTIADYYCRRTPAFWAVRRALAPLSVVLVREDDAITVYGVNDAPRDWRGELHYGAFALAGGWPLDERRAVTLPANASTRLVSFPAAAVGDPLANLACARLLAPDGTTVARNRLIEPYFRELRWPHPQLTITREGDCATFTSPTFVWGVCLDLAGEEPLADNFFDVWPGVPHAIAWPAGRELAVVGVGNLG
jgi:beta-mannosidase